MTIVPPPSGGLIGYSNYNLYSDCNDLTGVTVTIDIIDEMMAVPSGPLVGGGQQSYGISFQLNCLPPASSTVTWWQQYLMVVSRTGQDLRWGINNWDNDPNTQDQLINAGGHLAFIPSTLEAGYASIPAGYQFVITLVTDGYNNVEAAIFSGYDQTGAPFFEPALIPMTTLVDQQGNQVTEADLAPIVDIDLVIVGYANRADTTLIRGSGTITYEASIPLTVLNTFPPCTAGQNTGESSNVTYGELDSTPSTQIIQTFSVPQPPPSWVARNADGRLEMFVVGTDSNDVGSLWHLWQTAPSNGWTQQWESFGYPPTNCSLARPPAVAANADGSLAYFITTSGSPPPGTQTGGNGELWHQWQTAPSNGWSGWNSLGSPAPGASGMVLGTGTVVPNADGRLEVFQVANDGALWHRWQTAPNSTSWSSWESMGAPPGSFGFYFVPPAVAPSADGRLEIFLVAGDLATGQPGELWHQWQTAPSNGWSGWQSMGTPSGVEFSYTSTPTVVPSADGRLELFLVGMDSTLWHQWQTAPSNGWSGWNSMGTPVGVALSGSSVVTVAPSADGRLELFAVGMDGSLWHQWQTAPSNGWSGWNTFDAPATFSAFTVPGIARNADGRLEVFIFDPYGVLWHRWQTAPSNGWSSWETLPTPDNVLLAVLNNAP